MLIATLVLLTAAGSIRAQERYYALPFDEPDPFSPRDILYAIARAYPHRTDRVAWRDGDWAIRAEGRWFYFAQGRFLPQEARHRVAEYDPYPFYRYQPVLAPLPRYSAGEAAAIEERVRELERNPIRRHSGLLDVLWRINDAQSAWDRQKTTYFLGRQTLVHRELLEDLAAVEERILLLAESNREIQRFVDDVGEVYGYTYREVDGTDSLSYHAYGVAVDILPRRYQRPQLYWRWAREAGIAWYKVPYEERFMIPQPVVEAFEAHGFIWGGKWRFYDTIHFEYRPELLLLNGFEIESLW